MFLSLRVKYQLMQLKALSSEKYAYYVLTTMKNPRVSELLIKELMNGNEAAVRALIGRRDPNTVESLARALNDKYSGIELKIVYILGQRKDLRSIELLVNAIRSDERRNVRKEATKALRGIKEPCVVEPLIKALGNDEWCDVREEAAKALGELKDSRVIEPLINALGNDKASAVQEIAAKALGELKDSRAVGPLIKALSNGSFDVQATAAKALGELRDSLAYIPLIHFFIGIDKRVNSETILSKYMKEAAALALCDLKEPHSVESQINEPGEKISNDVQMLISKAWGELKKPSAIGSLIKTLDDNPFARTSAAWALGELKDPRAVEPLIGILGLERRRIATEALAKLGEPQWLEVIKGDNDDLVRLGKSSDTRVYESLVKALTHYIYNPQLRICAIMGLVELKDTRAVGPIIRSLDTHDWDVILAAVDALRRMKDNRAVEPLVNLLKHGYMNIRIAAACALNEMNALPTAYRSYVFTSNDHNSPTRPD